MRYRRPIQTSAVVLTKNGAPRLARCLESIARSGFAEEIQVCVDATTTDNTEEIARCFTPYVLQVATGGTLESALRPITELCRGEWILRVDDDEEIEGDWCRATMLELLNSGDYTHGWIPRRWLTFQGSRFIAKEPWFPDLQLRLLRKGSGVTWPANIHEPLIVQGHGITLTEQWIDHHILVDLDRGKREAKCAEYMRRRPEKHLSHFYLYEDRLLPTLPADELGFREACHMALIEGVSTRRLEPYVFGEEICFAKNGNATQYMRSGWSAPEEWGTWTEGECAVLHFSMKEPVTGSVRITFECNAYLRPDHPELRVNLVRRKELVASWLITSADVAEWQIDIRDLREVTQLRLDFHICQPASPADLGESSDGRKLGLGFRRLRLEIVPESTKTEADQWKLSRATTP